MSVEASRGREREEGGTGEERVPGDCNAGAHADGCRRGLRCAGLPLVTLHAQAAGSAAVQPWQRARE